MGAPEKSKGTVRFSFKSITQMDSNRSKEFTIYMFFTFGKKRFKISTGYKCNHNNWSFKKQKVKNNTNINNKDLINKHLNYLEENVNDVYIETVKNNELVTSELLKKRLLNRLNDVDHKDEKLYKDKQSLTDYFEKYIKQSKNRVSKGTLNTYYQALEKLKKYEQDKTLNKYGYLEFENIDENFLIKYKKYLMTNYGYRQPTAMKHIKKIKAVMNNALRNGITQNTKHSFFKTVEHKNETHIYLNLDEIESMHNKDLSFSKKHELARDIFLIGYYTGQRVSDYNNFSKNDIVTINGKEYLKFIQKKKMNSTNREPVKCPITPKMREIMKRYDNDFPPKMSEPEINKYIKEVGRMCDIKDLVISDYSNKKKKKNESNNSNNENLVPKHKLITTHTARRSFATNMYKKGMPTYDIMLFTQHKSEKVFYNYIKVKGDERISHIANSGFLD